MKFLKHRRRSAPSVIIISLIDILIVLLIFLMVTTTFKQQPAIKLALPESSQTEREGAAENNLIVTIAKQEPFFYLGSRPVTLSKLQEELTASVAKNPQTTVMIRPDGETPTAKLVNVMDAAKSARVKSVSMLTKTAGSK